MTFGEKLKEARKQAGLSQEQLAEKIGISRSTVAKWETGMGLPDIDNLKIISDLLDVSVDYLLDSGEAIEQSIIKESVDISKYKGTKRRRKDKIVREKYPEAKIFPLIAREKLSKEERVFSNALGILTDAPFNTAEIYHGIKESDKQYYLAEQKGKYFLVLVTTEFILSRAIACYFSNRFEIGSTTFIKCSYTVK